MNIGNVERLERALNIVGDEKFDWDTHVGAQTPKEFCSSVADAGDNIEMAISRYIAGVRTGEIFGQRVGLDANAEQDMANYIRNTAKTAAAE